jgi:hypothetical protein
MENAMEDLIGNPAEEFFPIPVLEENPDLSNKELMTIIISEIFRESLVYDCVVWCVSDAMKNVEALRAHMIAEEARLAQAEEQKPDADFFSATPFEKKA